MRISDWSSDVCSSDLELQNLPGDVTGKLAAHDAARAAAPRPGATSQEQRPPGFDDDSYNEQDGGAFVAWAQNKGHGSFDLRAARSDDAEPRTITSGDRKSTRLNSSH